MSRLGRNPFEKKMRAADIVRQMNEEAATVTSTPESSGTALESFAKFVLVDLRAESYVFGLKAVLLSLSLFE
jgi:hypothetical protein